MKNRKENQKIKGIQMNNSKFIKNIITGFGGQFIVIVLGIIVPRIFITSYGSDVNGLISTVTQIFTYLALLEAGIGQAAQNDLYKPVKEKNKEEINQICSSASTYFRKLTFYYGIGVILLSLLLPFVLKTNVDSATIFLIVIFEGLSGVISFYFIQTPSILIAVDGKSYVNNGIMLLDKIAGYIAKIVMASLGIKIVFVQLAYFLITVAKVFFYKYYFRKHYDWVKLINSGKKIKLKDRNYYILTEITWTIFSSTDMIVLSTFVSTQMSSVYGVYNMIFTNINVLLNAVYNSIKYLLGQAYHESRERYEMLHDLFTILFLGVMTVLMAVCYVLANPFISLYTRGITDIEYIYPSLPILFCLVQILSWSRYVAGNLTGLAGYAKQTSYISLIEALINVSFSIILVHKFGIVGVLFATVVALPLKVIWCIYVSDKKVMHRSYWKSVSIIGINFMFFGCVVLLSHFFRPTITTYGQFFMWGVILTLVFGVIGMGLNLLVNRDCWQVIRKYILKRG
ncbi:lipopolysaccharide biosynthesis protein [Anaerostipes faecalis]|uniref:lipopolysaccharide biosynthesis protein n=1 Tax=Anaerostipes faecalis TaxID=2738446 RepID=UPI003F0B41AC